MTYTDYYTLFYYFQHYIYKLINKLWYSIGKVYFLIFGTLALMLSQCNGQLTKTTIYLKNMRRNQSNLRLLLEDALTDDHGIENILMINLMTSMHGVMKCSYGHNLDLAGFG